MSLWEALAMNSMLLNAVLAGLAASVLSGIVGSYVVVKRITFISGSIAHSILGGMGFCLWLQRAQGVSWITPLHGALVTALLSAWIIGWIHLHYAEREDSVIAAVWSTGMAMGVLFLSQTPGFNVELTHFLIGNILWVSRGDLYTLLVLDIVVVLLAGLLHRRLVAICFDEDQARLQGLSVHFLYLLLLSFIALTTVVLIEVVGVILVLTMLTIPAAVANLFTARMSRMMLLATCISAIFCLVGTASAYHLDWPVGATIALVAGLVYIAVLSLKRRIVV